MTRPGKKYPRISCAMTDKDVLEELLNLFGGAIYAVRKQEAHHKQSWRWGVEGDNAAAVMERVKVYMFSRRRAKIDEILKDWYTYTSAKVRDKADRDERIREALKAYEDGSLTMAMAGELYGFSWLTIQKELNKVRALR